MAHLHMTEIDSMADGLAHNTGTRIEQGSESTPHLTAHHTDRISSTTGLLEPESDSLEGIQSSSRLRDNVQFDDRSSTDEGSIKVHLQIGGSDDSTTSSAVDESETGSDKKHTDGENETNGRSKRSLNYLGELLLRACLV